MSVHEFAGAAIPVTNYKQAKKCEQLGIERFPFHICTWFHAACGGNLPTTLVLQRVP